MIKNVHTGDPAVLHQIITKENLDIENLMQLSLEDLTVIAKRFNITTHAKSKVCYVHASINPELLCCSIIVL